MKTHQLLLPIAFVQGLWLWQRTPSLPVPDGNSGRFSGCGGRRLRVVGVGDSIMVGTGVRDQRHSLTASYARLLHERQHLDVDWRVHGIKGATSATVLRQVAPAVPRADVYIVSCGVNDATRGVPTKEFVANLGEMLSLLRQKSPRATILYAGLPPLDSIPLFPWPLKSVLAARVEEMRTAAAALFANFERVWSFRFPDTMPPDQFASDGFHPAESACERWAKGLLELWPQALGTPAGSLPALPAPRVNGNCGRAACLDGAALI
jgi:lysophospholipase L1-like esterase